MAKKTPAVKNQGAAIVLVSLVAGLVGGFAGSELNQRSSDSSKPAVTQQFISSEGELISTIAEDVGKSVVSINVTSQTNSFFGPFSEVGSGTGIIISEDGYIITNRHVIPEGADGIEITMSDGTIYTDVEVVGRDPRSGVDIAFLKINDVDGLQPARIGDSDGVKVGEQVVAIGNALGEFQNSVTTGIISGRSRPIGTGSSTLTNLLQTDAAINPGNSGGPLVNINGEVIGINTAVANGENLGFAIAISDVSGSINSVLESGDFQVPYLGVRYEVVDEAYAVEYNLDATNGAYIRSRGALPAVLEDSPAEKAGLQDKDIIIKVDGTDVNQDNGLSSLIGRKKVGDEVELTIVRDDQEITVTVTLEAAPDSI